MELWYSRAFHDSFYMFSEYLGCGRYGRMRTLLDIDMTRFISDLHFASGNYRGGAPWMLITPSCFGQWVAFGRRVACKLGLGRPADALGQICGMGVVLNERSHNIVYTTIVPPVVMSTLADQVPFASDRAFRAPVAKYAAHTRSNPNPHLRFQTTARSYGISPN